jgi:lia operon protein LiaF
MGEQSSNRKRNTWLVLIAAGVFLLLEKKVGFFTLVALGFIVFGIYHLRTSIQSQKKGYIYVAIGTIILLGGHFSVIIGLILISLGLFYLKSKRIHKDGPYFQKQKIIESLRWDKDPWVLQNISIWSVIGELHLDFSLAIPESREVTVVMQGIIGDIDIIVPEDLGVSVQSSVFFGQIDAPPHKEAGLLNKLVWQSPNYAASTYQVKLMISYVIADVDIKVI